jgi:DNA mismatch repair protein MutL
MEEPRIAILDPDVVNQIAAGEVVERPASVVKELVENALDAGAYRIDVLAERGGCALVRVADNGRGMSPAEAELSLRRHATSKLRSADDLLSLQTMGFRGEALPSIASVSKLSIVTRAGGVDAGHQLRLEGKERLEQGPVGARVGTVVEVADLFFNTPARLKFLKSTATETAHISDVVTQLALANPSIHLTLTLDGRRALDLPPSSSRLDRARGVLGRRANQLLCGQIEDQSVKVEVFVSPPAVHNRSARSVHSLVNRRVVRHRALIHAVTAGYNDALERGTYPLAVIYLDIAPGEVDVNVHPQKVEVRFSDPNRVLATVRRCVGRAVTGDDPVLAGASERTAAEPPPRTYRLATSTQTSDGGGGEGYEEHRNRVQEATQRFWAARQRREALQPPSAGAAATHFDARRVEPQPGSERRVAGLRQLGQVLGRYLLFEAQGALLLLDRAAAAERVTSERLRRALEETGVTTERLPGPIPVELTKDQHAVAGEHRAGTLERLGFEVEHFGGTTWTVRALPRLLQGQDAAELVRVAVDALAVVGPQDLGGVLSALARGRGATVDDETLLGQLEGLGLIDIERLDETIWIKITAEELAGRAERR